MSQVPLFSETVNCVPAARVRTGLGAPLPWLRQLAMDGTGVAAWVMTHR